MSRQHTINYANHHHRSMNSHTDGSVAQKKNSAPTKSALAENHSLPMIGPCMPSVAPAVLFNVFRHRVPSTSLPSVTPTVSARLGRRSSLSDRTLTRTIVMVPHRSLVDLETTTMERLRRHRFTNADLARMMIRMRGVSAVWVQTPTTPIIQTPSTNTSTTPLVRQTSHTPDNRPTTIMEPRKCTRRRNQSKNGSKSAEIPCTLPPKRTLDENSN